MLGDVRDRAHIGFAGPRVIQDTIKEKIAQVTPNIYSNMALGRSCIAANGRELARLIDLLMGGKAPSC